MIFERDVVSNHVQFHKSKIHVITVEFVSNQVGFVNGEQRCEQM